MPKRHYVFRRSRSGRFNFALITDDGRLTGSVSISLNGQESVEIDRQARAKIRAIAESFAAANGLVLTEEAGPYVEEEADYAPAA
ncbi:hypothetical protein [Methylobacterium sp. WL120]|uniref:hypothetical protein n=1 Tax=Methylobacterium sp. WL120 TaxID=2603887 RepID=UPI0011C9E3EC|nr:hypothetical protein [Methylobacterium sp. WL120]TXM64602.1 hypothetical protein FV229_18070 [Methylobacterium sp. WL120]